MISAPIEVTHFSGDLESRTSALGPSVEAQSVEINHEVSADCVFLAFAGADLQLSSAEFEGVHGCFQLLFTSPFGCGRTACEEDGQLFWFGVLYCLPFSRRSFSA